MTGAWTGSGFTAALVALTTGTWAGSAFTAALTTGALTGGEFTAGGGMACALKGTDVWEVFVETWGGAIRDPLGTRIW